MKSSFSTFTLTLLLVSSFASADTPLIHTTVSDSSRVVFIAQTPLSWETVENHNLDYIRFIDCAVADSIGYPELPMITCLIAMPDSVTPVLEYSWAGMQEQHVDPVYPAPAQVVSYEYTPAVVDSFVQDSTAYASSSFWPGDMVRIIGETRLCGQRLIKVQLFPARYRAADSTLVTVSSISTSLSFDSTEAVWSSIGLGSFENLVQESPIIGYHNVTQQPILNPTYFGQVDPGTGPSRMPDYVIICASGLYSQCSDAIDDLAEHRVALNGFDVALVTTDDILDDFGGTATRLSAGIIRDFTEYMWKSWPQASLKKPSYLLLIGDHEGYAYYDEPWYLPTYIYDFDSPAIESPIGNDEWFAYFNGDRSISNDFANMRVGRLSVRNGGVLEPDTLSDLIYNLIDIEDPIQQAPLEDNRRRILRLAGAGQDHADTFIQTYGVLNTPSRLWTGEFSSWLGYEYCSWYCGDGRYFTSDDMSLMKSSEWVNHCLTELGTGAGVAFYTDHGSTHLFSAGLEWISEFIPQDEYTKGARDSTFNNYQITTNLEQGAYYSPPFLLLLCCSAGTFNHTLEDHEDPSCWPEFCYYNGQVTPPAHYDFGTDCIAERLLKHTDVPLAGVFCGSQPSCMHVYDDYGIGILEAIYVRGHGRLGDAIASARSEYINAFLSSNGNYFQEMGQFNLLGDPALDISDRVRYPNKCDLLVYPGDMTTSEYPLETSSGVEIPLSFRVRNNGAQTSDECEIRITFSHDQNIYTDYIQCDELASGADADFEYTWNCPAWLDPPMEVTVSIEADWEDECEDSWRPNNTCTFTLQLNDTYPVAGGWMIEVNQTVSTTPVLANIDSDADLEVVALTGNSLTAFEPDGTVIWELSRENIQSASQILASDLDHDGKSEFIVGSSNGVLVIGEDGSVVQTISEVSVEYVIGDMFSRTSGIELCLVSGTTLYLYNWNNSQSRFVPVTSKTFSFSPPRMSNSLSCADIDGTSSDDVVFCTSADDISIPLHGLLVYDWDAAQTLYDEEWEINFHPSAPAAGQLSGTAVVGYPLGSYTYGVSENPAVIIDVDGSSEIYCEEGTVSAGALKYGVIADWDPLVSGTDTFIVPSEMEALAWDVIGDAFGNWPTDQYSGGVFGSTVSPSSLGNLDNGGYDDVLFSTSLNGKCTLLAYDSDAQAPDNSDFPITLPDGVTSMGGFSIADIDRDGYVEIVFGTSDGYLHCWELGSCSTGYAPWTQYQHDAGRTGVLE